MNKTSESQILNQIKDKLIIYLLSGKIKPQTILNPNFNIDGLDRLLKVHFVISDNVINFINGLKKQIRHVKVTTNQKSTEAKGSFRGKINFPKTIRHRLNANYNDKTLFIIDQISRKSETDENIVLKEALRSIREIIDNDLKQFLNSKLDWVEDWEGDNYEKLKVVYEKNIYLRSIHDSKSLISDKMINRVRKSRTKLYRDAANLLYTYNSLTKHPINKKLAKKFLGETFIKPDRDTLFELYWCFKIIDLFQQNSKVKFLTRTSGKQLLAEWTNQNYIFELYHQGIGDFNLTQSLSKEDLPEIDGYLKRIGNSRLKNKNYLNEFFNVNQKKNFNAGIPDIFLIIKDKNSNRLQRVVIGEVKNSTKKQTAKNGLIELINYMSLLKKNKEYFNNVEKVTTAENIRGFLFIDNQRLSNNSVDSINVIRTDDKLKVDMFLN